MRRNLVILTLDDSVNSTQANYNDYLAKSLSSQPEDDHHYAKKYIRKRQTSISGAVSVQVSPRRANSIDIYDSSDYKSHSIRGSMSILPKIQSPKSSMLPHVHLISPHNKQKTYYGLSKEIDKKMYKALHKQTDASADALSIDLSVPDLYLKSYQRASDYSQLPVMKEQLKVSFSESHMMKAKLAKNASLIDSISYKHDQNRYKKYSEYISHNNRWGERYHDNAVYAIRLQDKKNCASVLDFSKVAS